MISEVLVPSVRLRIHVVIERLIVSGLCLVLLTLLNLRLSAALNDTPSEVLYLLLAVRVGLMIATADRIRRRLIYLLEARRNFVFYERTRRLRVEDRKILAVNHCLREVLLLNSSGELTFRLTVIPRDTLGTRLTVRTALIRMEVRGLIIRRITSVGNSGLIFLRAAPSAVRSNGYLS